MNFLQLLFSERSSTIITLYNFVAVTLVIFQYKNLVNSSRIQDLNLTNGDYVSEILRRSKRHAIPCEIPNYGLHTKYTILGETTATYRPGDFAQQYYTLEVSCDRGYNLKPFSDKRTVCINGQWNPPLTINCLQNCPSLKSTMSTSVTCKYGNIPLEDCKNPIEETTAFLSCNPLHEQDDSNINRIRLCKAGRWIPSISECYPICGTKRPEGVLNIVNGQNVTIGDYPWQIAIYNARKEYICGGSIIDRHIILTAAHCLTDYNGQLNLTSNYLIAAGKYYRKYDDDKDTFAQYSKVQHIYLPERYTGILNNYASDIAIILLADPFTISLRVQPVCIELNGESPHLYLSSNSNGIVTGWGYTEEGRELSEVLKELAIPFIPFRKCFKEVSIRFRKYITTDKICGGYLNNGTSVCGGDSGGALVFQNQLSDRYFVKGIVSTSPATVALTCDSNQYSLYTSVKDHVDFITNILAHNQIAQSLEYINEATDENGPNTHSCSSEQFISEMLHQEVSTPPQIIPKVSEFTINASSTFELRCLSKNFVTWTSPNNLEEIFSNDNLTKYSTIAIKSSKCDSVYESRLTISNASYLDVGYYYCHENTNDYIKNSSIYIYVYDDQKLFLMPEFQTRTVSENTKVILPCRPTAPDVHVKLLLNSAVEIPQSTDENNYVTYDSKRGFTYKTDLVTYNYKVTNNYNCSFSRGSYERSASINLTVVSFPNEPAVVQLSNKHLVVGQKLELLCATSYYGSLLPNSWIIPDLGAINNIHISNMNVFGGPGTAMESKLIIEHVKISDQGNYTCIATNYYHFSKNATIFIKIYER